MPKETQLNLADTLKALEKDYGKGAVINGGALEKYDDVVSTGSLELDIATGIGGIPIGDHGKLVEIYGWESSGKSTVCQTIVGNYQKKGLKNCLYLDAENSLEEEYSTKLGVDLNSLLIAQLDPYAGEGAFNKMERIVRTGEVGLVVVDSYNALRPKKEIDGEVGDNHLGLHARMLGQAVTKANSLCGQYGCTFLFVGQLREKIGVMFGSPETTQGGNALKFYAHMRMISARSTTKENSIMDGEVKLGNQHNVRVIKNKMGAPFKKAEFDIIYGQGIDKYSELIYTGHKYEVMKKYGESVTFGPDKYKIEDFTSLLRDNDTLFQEIRNDILRKAAILPPVLTTV